MESDENESSPDKRQQPLDMRPDVRPNLGADATVVYRTLFNADQLRPLYFTAFAPNYFSPAGGELSRFAMGVPGNIY